MGSSFFDLPEQDEISISDITSKMDNRKGEVLAITYIPRLDVIGTGNFPFIDERGIELALKAQAALDLEWSLQKVEFPLIGGVRSVKAFWHRDLVVNQASAAAVIVASLAGIALSFAFVSHKVEKVISESPDVIGGVTTSLSLAAVAILGLVAFGFFRDLTPRT